MKCREFVASLADYLSGEMAVAPRRAFDSHLADCPCCPSYTKTYLAAIGIARRALGHGGEPAPADLPEELVQAILADRETSA